ncbi:MAG: LytTR family transcriptional regulator DNA-binding domain-containing protein [Alphaproteobacteria bacterium]|nr:LytTR family transcriptional regulator DNA-binding domain-containing protein [Alphaproteobacteria bacterium]
MNDMNRNFTMREWMRFMANEALRALVVAFLFAITGALSSEDITPFALRLLLWALIMLPLWLGSAFICRASLDYVDANKYIILLIMLGVNCVFAFPSTLWLMLILPLFYGENLAFFDLFFTALIIGFCVIMFNWLFIYFRGNVSSERNSRANDLPEKNITENKFPETNIPEQGIPEQDIIARLPKEKRGELIYLKSADHYLEVKTDKGVELLLMRMKDAVPMLQNIGLQTHRSCWVSFTAMQKIIREGNQHYLLLKDGIKFPISRYHLPKIKKHLEH